MLLRDLLGDVPDDEVKFPKEFRWYGEFQGGKGRVRDEPSWKLSAQTISNSDVRGMASDPILRADGPVFDSWSHAAADLVGYPVGRKLSGRDSYGAAIVLPTTGPQIENVVVDEGTVQVELRPLPEALRHLVPASLSIKVEYSNKPDRTHFIRVTTSNVLEIPLEERPRALKVWLVAADRSLLDAFHEDDHSCSWKRRVLYPSSGVESELTKRIALGESIDTEFKEYAIPHSSNDKMQEIVETCIAFRNTAGGLLLIGVDKHGGVVGIDKALSRDAKCQPDQVDLHVAGYLARLQFTLSDMISPRSPATLSADRLGGHLVVMVSVLQKDASDLVYWRTDTRDIFVRTGATNRKPDTNSELPRLLPVSDRQP